MGVVYRRTDSKDAITMLHTGVAGLHHWCKQLTSGYSGVNINDFTSSWRSGLAFCAIIARFRPDLIEFDSLDVSKSYENCKTAFRLAETELNIPALLEASDMVDMRLLDRRSIITYVSQFYHKFNKLAPTPAARRSLRKKQETLTSKDSGLEDSLSDSRQSSPVPNSSRNSSPVSSSSRQSSSEDCPGKEHLSKARSYQSLPRKDSDKQTLKTFGPKNLAFIAALQKFSNISSSTPNLYKVDEQRGSKGLKNFKSAETQTESPASESRAIQTETVQYARSASINNLYVNSVPNCDKNRTNTVLQGLRKYRASNRIIQKNSQYMSCDNLVKPTSNIEIYDRYEPRHNQFCCRKDLWRSSETIGAYNTKHYEHSRDYCNQRYENPLYGYSPDINQFQGYNKKGGAGDEVIYQNSLPRPPGHGVGYTRTTFNNKTQSFSTLV